MLCAHACFFAFPPGKQVSESILFGLAVIIGLEPAASVIGDSVALLWGVLPGSPFEGGGEYVGAGGAGLLLPGASLLPFRLRHAGYHLNRIHFEITLNSVCSVNPSLDVYFRYIGENS